MTRILGNHSWLQPPYWSKDWHLVQLCAFLKYGLKFFNLCSKNITCNDKTILASEVCIQSETVKALLFYFPERVSLLDYLLGCQELVICLV